MLKWNFQRTTWSTYNFALMDQYNIKQLPISQTSLPMLAYLREALTNQMFAKALYSSNAFDIEVLSSEDKMDLILVCLATLENDTERD